MALDLYERGTASSLGVALMMAADPANWSDEE